MKFISDASHQKKKQETCSSVRGWFDAKECKIRDSILAHGTSQVRLDERKKFWRLTNKKSVRFAARIWLQQYDEDFSVSELRRDVED